MKTLFTLLLLALLVAPSTITAQQFGDFTYTSNSTGITITGYTGSNGSVTIPESITGLAVTAIGANAFYTSSLTHVSIPGSVISIGSSAFYRCTNLAQVSIASGVTSIGRTAFSYCHSLTNVFLPGNVTFLEGAPFSSCSNLAAITVDSLNPAFSSVDGVLFDRNQLLLIQYPGGKTGSYVLPGTTTEIGLGAFANCRRLTGVSLPSTVRNIVREAFHHCISLTYVEIPGSVTNLGHDAFKNCIALAGVRLSEGLISIGWAFRGCSNLTSITIPRSVSFVWEQAFEDCTSLKGIFFQGNAPGFSGSYTLGVFQPPGYYLPGTAGWAGVTFAGRPTVLWNPLVRTNDPDFGVGPGGFGFNITGTANIPIVVEATTNLADGGWMALQSLNLTNGSFHFSDPAWANYPACLYRIRSP